MSQTMLTISSFAMSAALFAAGSAKAQPVTLPPAAGDSGQVQDIVVTAQRTSQRMQDVPIAISALSAADAQVRGITGIETLAAAVPSLDIHIQGQAPAIFLRGVGTDQGGPNVEPSVALYVDGSYYPNAVANVFSFNNIDRIEVLKGPQGTLFGRNATGGVIQIITNDPQQTPAFRGSLGYGNYDTLTTHAYVTGGLTNNIAADLAVTYEDRGTGLGYNATLKQPVGFDREFGVRSKLLITPDDRTEIRLSGDYSYSKNDLLYQTPPGVVAPDGQQGYIGRFITRSNFPFFYTSKFFGGSLKINRDLEFGRLVSISTYHKSIGETHGDQDITPLPLNQYILREYTQDYSQEVQLLSSKGSKIQWSLGAFYFWDSGSFAPVDLTGTLLAPLPDLAFYGKQSVHSISGYAQATTPIFLDTNLTLGARYTNDKVDFAGDARSLVGAIIPYQTAHFTSSKPTWRVSLDHRFSPEVNAYLSYNRGVKTGGYNLFVPATSFAPEQLDAYEAGLKTDLFDRHLRLNLAAFYYDYKNIQVSIVQNGVLGVANAAGASLHGVDMDFQARVGHGLSVSGGASYLRGHYTDYKNAIYYPASIFSSPVPPQGLANGATGNDTLYSPKWTANLQADYLLKTSAGDFTLSGSMIYFDGSNSEPYGTLKMPRYTTLNSSLNWAVRSNVGLRIWGKNLTNEYYMQARIATSFGALQLPALPRTYGASVNVSF